MKQPTYSLKVNPSVLQVRFTWDINAWFRTTFTEIFVAFDKVGQGVPYTYDSTFFSYGWEVTSTDLTKMDSFLVRTNGNLLFSNVYEVWSTSRGAMLANIKDHAWNFLGTTYVSCECDMGHIEITETIRSRLLGKINFGFRRKFVIKGSVTGLIELESMFGYKQFVVTTPTTSKDVPAFNAVLTAMVKILIRAISEHD